MVLLHADGSFALAGCLLRKMSIWLYQLTVALVFKLGFAKVPKCDLNEPSQIFYQLHDLTSEIGHVKFYDRARYCADVPDRVFGNEEDTTVFVPVAACALLVIFSLPDTDTLVLSGEVLAKIYSGDIVLWNDTSIRQLNPDIILPVLHGIAHHHK
ncbi:putative serine/threonine-protein kinase/receptor [Trichinella pseudospiralis]